MTLQPREIHPWGLPGMAWGPHFFAPAPVKRSNRARHRQEVDRNQAGWSGLVGLQEWRRRTAGREPGHGLALRPGHSGRSGHENQGSHLHPRNQCCCSRSTSSSLGTPNCQYDSTMGRPNQSQTRLSASGTRQNGFRRCSCSGHATIMGSRPDSRPKKSKSGSNFPGTYADAKTLGRNGTSEKVIG